jgi:hypothetical protein
MKSFKIIKLNGRHNLSTKVDAKDFEWLSKEGWGYSGCAKPGVYYASKNKNLGRVNGKATYKKRSMHREIMDCPDDMFVDHINGDTLDNRRENLRICTRNQNQWNRLANIGKEFKGAYYHKDTNRWQARIQHNNKKHHLGYFKTAKEANEAYNDKANELRKEFVR